MEPSILFTLAKCHLNTRVGGEFLFFVLSYLCLHVALLLYRCFKVNNENKIQVESAPSPTRTVK